MSKRHPLPPINLQDFKDKQEREGRIPVQAGDRTFFIRPPQLLSDDEYTQLQSLPDADMIGQARLMVDDYDGFVAAGGSAMLASTIINELTEGTLYDEGEGEASSRS